MGMGVVTVVSARREGYGRDWDQLIDNEIRLVEAAGLKP